MSYAVRASSALVTVMVLTAMLWVPAPAAAADQPTASFENDVTTVTRGDEVEITVSHSESGYLHVGGEDYGYHLNVSLSGSGSTTVTIDTYDPMNVSGGNLESPRLDEPLEPATYMMNVTIGGVERAIGQLKVEPRGNTSATTYVAPASANDTDGGLSADSLPGTLTERQRVARGDLAVFRLDESGLETAFNADDVTGGAAANGIEISLNQLEVRPNFEQRSFLATEDNGTVAIFEDFENDVVYVVWDTSELPVEGDAEEYELTVTLNGTHNDFVEEDSITARSKVTVVRPTVSLAVDNETVYPWESLDVNASGETTLAPGTTLELRARAPGQPFLKLVPVTVGPDGTFNASLLFAPEDRGLTFPLWVRDYRESTEKTMRFPESDASLTFVDQETDGTYVTISSVRLSTGGFVTVETADEEPLGTSAYLPPGAHENVVVEFDRRLLTDGELLAIARSDEDRNRAFSPASDPPYRTNGTTNGSIVADDAMVGLEPGAKTPTPTATAETAASTATASTTATATPYPVTERTPLEPAAAATNTGIPLSPGLAVIALLAVGFIARRRR